ncbi:RcnB family protein [Sphingomonas sp. LT1P40]|uniref:RcnB family protein n=1 Tax=Alteristakelama amylovorans TaxID=3096166 RepID=UPI002FC5BB6E
MKNKLMFAALIAAVAMPAMAAAPASAQSQREVRRDRQDLREERGELRRAQRTGDRRDIREERRDVREARRDVRDSVQDRNRRWGNDDWRGYRTQNRRVYSRGNWRAPFRYNGFSAGVRIAPQYYGSRYYINDPWRYRLPAAGYNQRWVRHYDDMLLVDTRRGRVIRVIRNFFW